MIKSIVIDDEPNSRELLTNMLTNYCENVEVLGEAADATSGVNLIREQNPELVFLDIEMPKGSGFDLLNQVQDVPFAVVFVTGYDQYAIKAIKYAALDYLLKPISLKELRIAVKKAIHQRQIAPQQLRLIQQYRERTKALKQIILPDRQQYLVIDLDQILYLEAQGNYVLFHLENGKTHLSSQSLSHYEQLLESTTFFRTHKSNIVNLTKVKRYDSGRMGQLFLSNEVALDIAARRKSTFIQRLSQLGK